MAPLLALHAVQAGSQRLLLGHHYPDPDAIQSEATDVTGRDVCASSHLYHAEGGV